MLVVGESQTGKSTMIQGFLEYEESGAGSGPKSSVINSNSDFTLKIIKIDGEKVRLQLWDQGNSKDPVSTFQPLYTRHAAGCIVVGNTANLSSLKK